MASRFIILVTPEKQPALLRSLARSLMSDNLDCSPRTSTELLARLNIKPARSRSVGTLFNKVKWKTGTTWPFIWRYKSTPPIHTRNLHATTIYPRNPRQDAFFYADQIFTTTLRSNKESFLPDRPTAHHQSPRFPHCLALRFDLLVLQKHSHIR